MALARAHIKGRILSSSSSLENIRVESSSPPPPTCDSSNNIVCFGSLEMGWISSHAPASSHHYVILPGGLRDKVRSPQDLAIAVCLGILVQVCRSPGLGPVGPIVYMRLFLLFENFG